MLYEILKSIRNFFPDTEKQIQGHFVVEDGVMTPFPTLADGQYVLVEGSSMNDGVRNDDFDEYTDEEFDGIVTPLKIPSQFLELVESIEAYNAKDVESPFASESFGGYSYTKKTNSSWQEAYRTRLNAWRKL